jgi:phosphate-selective porin OprO and OprP
MHIKQLSLALCLLGGLALPGVARADSVADEISALKKQIELLNEKVRALERQVLAGTNAPAATSQAAPALTTNAVSPSAADKKIEQLDEKVRGLERQQARDQQTMAETRQLSSLISIGPEGFRARSADSNWMVALHATLQVDSRTFFDDGGIKGNDGFLLRRARPIIEGTIYRDFDFNLTPDFGSGANGVTAAPTPQIYDAYLNYRYIPELQLRAGKFKSPVGLEQLQSDVNTAFNERALVTDLVPTRDLGVALHGQILGEVVNYTAGIFNGVGDARLATTSDFEDDKDFEGRLFVEPLRRADIPALRRLGLGVGGSYGSSSTANALPNTSGGALPGYTTTGQQQFFAYNPVALGGTTPVVVADGVHWRLSPQAYYYYGPFGLLGEYAISSQEVSRTVADPITRASLQNTAWQVTASWMLTGEEASYFGVNPAHPFQPSVGHWGALQLAVRYSQLEVDDNAFPLFSDPATSAHSAGAWAVGLNWFLNRNLRVNASFSHTIFGGAGGAGTTAPANVTRQPESVFFTRIQLGF